MNSFRDNSTDGLLTVLLTPVGIPCNNHRTVTTASPDVSGKTTLFPPVLKEDKLQEEVSFRGTSQEPKPRRERRSILLDTLKLVRKFEEIGLSTRGAERVTTLVVDIVMRTQRRMEESFTRKEDLERQTLLYEARARAMNLGHLEVQQMQAAALARDLQALRAEVLKLKLELQRIVNTASREHALSLSLENTSVREGLTRLDKTLMEIESRIQADVDENKINVERMKTDVMTYCAGTTVSSFYAASALLRIWRAF
eukprot:CAMPEP_0196571792 /NCGR_PEP_ID=MMETSP1081-20130531/1924_1 /TAXON_ID=36882 /ORGANISM="Pyramimonas amylifera, Strain CCMP720" /LENGTH=254 /DNA_ID=CAMNT_0041888867 /DNA_START=382 /DNA_END=1146 /DNA_ORIENTATION=-